MGLLICYYYYKKYLEERLIVEVRPVKKDISVIC